MTLRDDLEKVIGEVTQADASQSDYDFANAGDKAFYLLRDHGQALLDAVRDAERYRWLRDVGVDDNGWEVTEEGKNKFPGMHRLHIFPDDLNAAIDAAMEGER